MRKPAAFISSISDDRGSELSYGGMPISEVFQNDLGVGGVLSLLWFRRQLPPYAAKFIEMVSTHCFILLFVHPSMLNSFLHVNLRFLW